MSNHEDGSSTTGTPRSGSRLAASVGEPPAVPYPGLVELSGFGQSCFGVLAYHLEKFVPSGQAARIGHDKRLVDEPAEHGDGVADPAQLGRGVQIEPAGAHRQLAKRRSLLVGQQLVAPIEGRGQGLLTVDGIPRLARTVRASPSRSRI